MPLIIKGKTLYQLSKVELDLILIKANKTRRQSIIGQVEFEKKVIEFCCHFHPDYSFKNVRNKVILVDLE